jgi:hypothetical protein
MNKRILILVMASLVSICSCKNAITRKYGVTEPRIESLGSVSATLKKYSSDYPAHLCIFRDSASLVDWFRNKNLPGRSHFYNSAGYRIITQDSLFCSGVEADFAGNLKSSAAYRIDSLTTFDKLKRNILPVGEKADLDPSKYAFTCVVFWARFMGKVNDASFVIAEAALKSQPAVNGKVNLLFVDMDIMDFWNTSGNMIQTKIDKR